METTSFTEPSADRVRITSCPEDDDSREMGALVVGSFGANLRTPEEEDSWLWQEASEDTD